MDEHMGSEMGLRIRRRSPSIRHCWKGACASDADLITATATFQPYYRGPSAVPPYRQRMLTFAEYQLARYCITAIAFPTGNAMGIAISTL